jgi:hypothetical protein
MEKRIWQALDHKGESCPCNKKAALFSLSFVPILLGLPIQATGGN